MPHRVLFTDLPWGNADIERRELSPHGIEVVIAPADDEQTLASLANDVDAIATCWADVSERVIQAAPRCRHIARMGIGLDNIDVDAATRRGIPVTNVPDYCVDEVAQHALALILAAARNIAFFHLRSKRGEYDLQAAPPVHRLSTRTLGLAGFGRTGRRLFRCAKALGMNVIAHSRSGDDRDAGCCMVDFETLLSESDYISIHMPLCESTQHLFDADAFSRMKPTAWLINTSRGGLIDSAALWQALQGRRIAGAALDVFEPEPPDLSQPLYQDERVLLTPHAAFVSVESLVELRTRVAAQILSVLEGRRPENLVNPQILSNP